MVFWHLENSRPKVSFGPKTRQEGKKRKKEKKGRKKKVRGKLIGAMKLNGGAEEEEEDEDEDEPDGT